MWTDTNDSSTLSIAVFFFFFENKEKILGYLIRFASVITRIQIVVFFRSRTQVDVFVCMIVGIVYENDNHCYIAGPFLPKARAVIGYFKVT